MDIDGILDEISGSSGGMPIVTRDKKIYKRPNVSSARRTDEVRAFDTSRVDVEIVTNGGRASIYDQIHIKTDEYSVRINTRENELNVINAFCNGTDAHHMNDDMSTMYTELENTLTWQKNRSDHKKISRSTLVQYKGSIEAMLNDNYRPSEPTYLLNNHRCNATKCNVHRIKVSRYDKNKHLCAIIEGRRVCYSPKQDNLHEGESSEDHNFFVCEDTGKIHLCGSHCDSEMMFNNKDNEYICNITGIVIGVDYRNEWWADGSNDNNEGNDVEMDEDNTNSNMYHDVDPSFDPNRKKTRKKGSKSDEATDDLTKTNQDMNYSVKIKQSLHYHHHPFEKTYFYYFKRCKSILWYVMYSPMRHDIERNKLLNNFKTTTKKIDHYEKSCVKNRKLCSFHHIRNIVRENMHPRTVSA
jgi:hypothetical protein